MNTPTPETDAKQKLKDMIGDEYVSADFAKQMERERDSWREAAYLLAEALPPSWEELQPPAEQLRKFKEMVALQNEKTKKS